HESPAMAFAWVHPDVGSHASVVHGLVSAHESAVPVVQVPAPSQVSWPLQRSASSHDEPAVAFECAHPVVESQLSVVHGFASLQSSALPARHEPDASQVSAPLQALLSLQLVPLGAGVQTPLVQTSQVPHEMPVPQIAPPSVKSALLSSVSVALASRVRMSFVA